MLKRLFLLRSPLPAGRLGGEMLPQINLLRGIAALMVCYYHFCGFDVGKGPIIPRVHPFWKIGQNGYLGVYVFFVISGFVIPFAMQKGAYQLKKAGRFLLKRSIRLEPPYLASIAVILSVTGYFSMQWGMPFAIDFKRLLLHIGYLIPFTNGKYEWYGIIYWTLGVEFQYYLLLTLLFPLLNSDRRILRYLVLLLFIAGPFLTNDAAFLPKTAPCFVPGFLLFLVRSKKLNVYELLFFLGAAVSVIAVMSAMPIAITMLCAFIFIWTVSSNTWIGNRLGDISYSLYLIHAIVGGYIFGMYDWSHFGLNERFFFIFCVFLICLACTIVFWFLFERPAKKLSSRIRV